jgi:hypothetical protein
MSGWTDLGEVLGVPVPGLPRDDVPEAIAWARSGAMALTGRADGPPLLSPGSPATWTQAGLDVIAGRSGREVAGVSLLGERAAMLGLGRRGPRSAGGFYRALAARDGWFGISLGRESDRQLVPALVEREVAEDPWTELSAWLDGRSTAEAAERTALLGLAAAPLPDGPTRPSRPPVVATLGGRRRKVDDRPLVVDLSSLWAGPLCAHLLHLAGARVITVESATRPDGARTGSPRFYELLHGGHESVRLRLPDETCSLERLLREADVVIEASRPRALAQLGVDALTHVADGTIWIGITAYGRDGENAMRVGFGDDVAAGAGLVAFDRGDPCPAGDALADPLTGVTAAAAAILALGGSAGCLLDVSMHDVAAAAAQPNEDPPAVVTRKGCDWVVTCAGQMARVCSARQQPADQTIAVRSGKSIGGIFW